MDGRYRRVVDLVELTGLLQARVSGVSIDQIAEKFEVSRRTAERMLEALRERFPELEAELREGRKYWRLPSPAQALPLRLPQELAVMSERVAELEAQVLEQRQAREQSRASPGWVESALSMERFAEAMARSIRNPLASLLSVTESALASNDERTAALEQISRLAMRMSRSIDRTLRLLRCEEPKLERVCPRQVLESVAEATRAAARAAAVEIEIDADPQLAPLTADRDQLALALGELSKNAIDAMPDGGDLRLRARRIGTPPSIRFNVCDAGPGIPAAVREKAFEPFFTTREDASGLGLPLARAIARRHGGRVAIAGRGSRGGGCVFLQIPVDPQQGEGGGAGG